MRRLHDSVVLQEELDGLGHMNSRFYSERANRAHRVLAARLGLGPEALAARGAALSAADVFTRFHREQFAGAPLAVYGGVLSLEETAASFFYDVRNAEKDEPAATVIMRCALLEGAARAPAPLPRAFVRNAEAEMVSLPAHGAPRSLDLAPPRLAIAFGDILARLGQQETANFMNQRRARVIEPADCDSYGFLRDEQDLMAKAQLVDARDQAPPGAFRGPSPISVGDGRRLGWALLETRAVRLAQPRIGDAIEMIGAEIDIQAKTRRTRRWTFNRSAGAYAAITDTVTIALDLDARRSTEIPDDLRAALARSHAPEFA